MTVAVDFKVVGREVDDSFAGWLKASLAEWAMVALAAATLAIAVISVHVANQAREVAERTRQTAETALNRETRQEAYVAFMQQAYAYRDARWCDREEQRCSDIADLADGSGIMPTLVAVRLAGGEDVVGNVRGCLFHWTQDDQWKTEEPWKPVRSDACSAVPADQDDMTKQLDRLTVLMTEDVGALQD